MGEIDAKTVASFGKEWSRFTQSETDLCEEDHLKTFHSYFHIFPWGNLPPSAVGADIGCGSGRWAKLVAPRVGTLIALDPSPDALDVARSNLADLSNIKFVLSDAASAPIEDSSLDFAYCLGVLHHTPDTEGGLEAIAAKLKPGAPLLLYLYYDLDNRPGWYRLIWLMSNVGRRVISKLPETPRALIASFIAAVVYFPLAKLASLLDHTSTMPKNWPLSYYKDKGFYVMKTDAYDRFCTPLEKRFSRTAIDQMLRRCGFETIRFSEQAPFWVSLAYKS